ncbi:unnamed protein product [Hymenolepis diminuta]|uniref:DAG1 domain-containing protein n=1 Tax=Hymenolepis diminuta TaxID=6216 RepID=A0A0R3ST60_HYMDI|nr:unnamed protein product [Hymenolepis diminuta]
MSDWVSPPEHSEDNPKDGPFVAVIAIGSTFLLLTISILAIILVFLRKQARKDCQNRNDEMNFEARGGDVYVNPSSEWRCSLDSDSFEDMSDISMEIDVDEETEGRIDQATNGWIAVNPYLCPKHSRIARIEGSEIRSATCIHHV